MNWQLLPLRIVVSVVCGWVGYYKIFCVKFCAKFGSLVIKSYV